MVGLGSAQAQVLYGSITGTVFDNSGAVVPDVKVNIINQQTGEVRTVTTNQTGGYVPLDVLPSAYTVEVPRTASFAAYKTEGIQLEVDRQVRLDITLQPGTVTTEVTVTSAAAYSADGNRRGERRYQPDTADALPITSSAGRNYQALYTIIPGAAAVSEKIPSAPTPRDP